MKERKSTKNQKRLKIIRAIIDSYGLSKLTEEDLNDRQKMEILLIRFEADIAIATKNPHLMPLIIKNNRRFGIHF